MHYLRLRAVLALLVVVVLQSPVIAQPTEIDELDQRVSALYKAGKFAEALPMVEQYVAATKSSLGEDDPRTATAIDWLANVYQTLARYADAEPYYKRALAIREKVLGPQHPDLATSLNHLAGLHQDQSRFPEAEAFVKRALEIRQKHYGPDHPDVAASLDSLAGLYQDQARYADAEALFEQALTIRKKALGSEHLEVATSLNYLAALYRDLDRLVGAEPLFKQALAIREKALGPEHPDVAIVLNNLAGLYRDQGHFADAEKLYNRALNIREKVFGPQHPDFAATLGSLGVLYKAQARYIEAEKNFKRTLEIREKTLGPEHPDVAYGLDGLADLYQEQDRLEEADFLINRAVQVREKRLGPSHPDVGASLGVLAGIREKQGQTKEAERFYLRALTIQERALSAAHLDVASTRGNLGSLYKSEGRVEEAKPLLESALAIRQKALVPDHPAIAISLLQLSDLYRLQGRLEDSQKLFKRAAGMRKAGIREVSVFFATDRQIENNTNRTFGNKRSSRNQVTYGEVTVAIPKGLVNNGRSTKPGAAATDDESMTDVRRLSLHEFKVEEERAIILIAQSIVQQAKMFKSEALVFVHGFNVSFEDAARRAGQIAYDLDFDGAMFLFSWPSQASLGGYLSDSASVDFAAPHFIQLLQMITKMKLRKIHVVAHSMGNLVLVRALERMAADTRIKLLPLAEIINASPDVDVDHYAEFVKRMKEVKGTNITLYASASDKALWISSSLRSVARAGYISDDWTPTLGADVIDITGAGARLLSFNHDVYASDRLLAQDMRGILRGERPPDQRTTQFKRKDSSQGIYWKYERPAAATP